MAIIGTVQALAISVIISIMSLGPVEQFVPSESTPRELSTTAAVVASVPYNVLSPSKDSVVIMAVSGAISLAAITAALVS